MAKSKAVQFYDRDSISRIIRAFAGSGLYQLVKFLFLTGCKPEEALSLRWSDVGRNYSSVSLGISHSVGESVVENDATYREFPCDVDLADVLMAVMTPDPGDGLVFPGIDMETLEQQWDKRVGQLAKERKYFDLYPLSSTRQSFIVMYRRAGFSSEQIAPLVGETPEAIEKTYGRFKRCGELPNLNLNL